MQKATNDSARNPDRLRSITAANPYLNVIAADPASSLFSVREGRPTHEALEVASDLLAAALGTLGSVTFSIDQTESRDDADIAGLHSIQFLVKSAKAAVDACLK